MDDPISHFKLPVQTHLSIQSNLVSAADEPELLAADFAELALRDFFAAVIILTDVFQVTVGANKIFVNPKYGSTPLCAHASVGEPAGLWNVPKCISNFVTGITGCRGEEPP